MFTDLRSESQLRQHIFFGSFFLVVVSVHLVSINDYDGSVLQGLFGSDQQFTVCVADSERLVFTVPGDVHDSH